MAHRALSRQPLAVGRDHAARFLAAMLQRVQAEIGQTRGLRVPVDAKHAALFTQFVFERIDHAFRLSRLRMAFNRASQSSGKTRPLIRVINMPARCDRDRKQRRSRVGLLKIEMQSQWLIGELNLMRERLKFWSVLALLAAVFAVLFIAQATKTQARVNVPAPMAGDDKTTFDSKCASCHGKDGRAKSLHARHVHARDMTDASWQNEVTDERLFNSITKGKGKMPAYGKKLSDDQIDALVRYVRQFKR